MKCKIPLFGVVVLILGFFICVSPVSGILSPTYTAPFNSESASTTSGPISVTWTLPVKDTDIEDITIAFDQVDAFIEDSSFNELKPSREIPPFISRKNHIYTIDRLKKGETLTIFFNAYPKTIGQTDIKVADVRITYTPVYENYQKGIPITEPPMPIKSDTHNSVWFAYNDLVQKNSGNSGINYGLGILVIIEGIIIVVLIVLFFRMKLLKEKAIKKTEISWKSDLEQVRTKLRSAGESDIPQILSTVDTMLASDRILVVETGKESGSGVQEKKPKEKQRNTGGY